MSEITKPASALVVVTVVAAILLGFVHGLTKEPIAAQQVKIEAEAIKAIFANADENTEAVAVPENAGVERALRIFENGAPAGYAIFASSTGYSGSVGILVGIGPGGAIQGVRVLSHSETPGLGANAANDAFTGQYKGKAGPLKVVKSAAGGGDEIQAITSATITSSAVTKAVNNALSFYKQSLAG